MESVPLTAEAIALTEKKMDMTLEDIIKMSKKRNPKGKKAPREPIKKRPFQNSNSNQGNAKVQRFMESRSSIRQGKEVQNQMPRTMDALFAQMKQQRMRTMTLQQANAAPGRQFAHQWRVQQKRRGRGFGGRNGGNQ